MTWTTQQRFKTENGLAVSTFGEGAPLILLHGVGLRSESWSAIIEHLQDTFSIHAIDLPGHGDSQRLKSGAITLMDYSDNITAYLKGFREPIYLTGHSMGAMIALNIAIRSPDLVRGVAALNAIYRRSTVAKKAVQTRAAALKEFSQNDLNTDVTFVRWFGKEPADELLAAAQSCKTWLHQTPISEYQRAYSIFAHHDGPDSAQLSGLKMPTLFITGADEPNSTPEMSRKMATLAPMGIAKVIEGAAHMMPMTHAAEVATAIKEHNRG